MTLLDESDRPLRPAILWNDGRATRQCEELERLVPGFAEIVGCRAMAGFPAPKLRWLRAHEPERLDRARRILLPKDVIRRRLTGDAATDAADGSATLLMDTLAAKWEPSLVAASGVSSEQLPRIVRSAEIALRRATRSAMPRTSSPTSTARGWSGWRRAKARRRWTSVLARSADCRAPSISRLVRSSPICLR